MEMVVTGSTGRLGGALVREWEGGHMLQAPGREDLDLGKPGELEKKLESLSFDVIVNCAAMSDVERCEICPEEAYAINAESPRILARVCARRRARFVHFSTDYVLDGSREGLKGEEAAVLPLNHYARTKQIGEEKVQEENPSAIVGRVSWLFGVGPGGIVESLYRRALGGEAFRAVDDKFSKPTSAREIARMVLALLTREDLTGLFHLAHPGEPESWWSVATKVVQIAHEEELLEECPEVRAEGMAQAERLKSRRPVHTAMDPVRLRSDLRWRGVSWEEEARLTLSSLRRNRRMRLPDGESR